MNHKTINIVLALTVLLLLGALAFKVNIGKTPANAADCGSCCSTIKMQTKGE
jgi:hypothetical protein